MRSLFVSVSLCVLLAACVVLAQNNGFVPPERTYTANKLDNNFIGNSQNWEGDTLRINSVQINTTFTGTNNQGDPFQDCNITVTRWSFVPDPTYPDVISSRNAPRLDPNDNGARPVGMLELRFLMSYAFDGLLVNPSPQPGFSFAPPMIWGGYRRVTDAQRVSLTEELANDNVKVYVLFQSIGQWGLTAQECPLTFTGTVGDYNTNPQQYFNWDSQFEGAGYYWTVRRTTSSSTVAPTLTVGAAEKVYQSVGGDVAPATNFDIATSGPSERFNLTGVRTPTKGGAYLGMQVTAASSSSPAFERVFLSSTVFQLSSAVPDSTVSVGVPIEAGAVFKYDTTTSTTSAANFRAGTAKLYTRASALDNWTPVASTVDGNGILSYTMTGSEFSASSPRLFMSVQAETPNAAQPVSSTAESSSSSSTAPESSSTAPPSSSTPAPSSSSSSSSSSTAPSSSTPAPSSSTASSSSSSSSSSSTAARLSSTGLSSSSSSSSSTGNFNVSSSSSSSSAGGVDDNAAASNGASFVAMIVLALGAMAAVATL